MELYKIIKPKQQLPIIVNIPHSGTYIPSEIKKGMTNEIQKALYNCDWYLPELYDFLPTLGITLIYATHSRYVVDLNRNPGGDLYGSFFKSLIAQRTGLGKPVYKKDPTREQLEKRVSTFYEPYHKTLKEVIKSLLKEHKKVYLIDLHSFMGPITNDVCLGNVNGQSCSTEFLNHVQKTFQSLGYDTVTNEVYVGGYITRSYSDRPQLESLQIEIRYTTYLDESELDLPKIPNVTNKKLFSSMKEDLQKVFKSIIEYI